MVQPCSPDCVVPNCQSHVFDRIIVMPRIAGGTRVEWSMHPDFSDPAPHTFQLQVGVTDNQDADDWTNVGLPAVDVFYFIDDEQRVFGMTQWTHYRIKLTTSRGVYYSETVDCAGNMDFRHWRLMQETIRRELLMFRHETGQEGYLLKQKFDGTRCDVCRDYMTDEPKDPDCPSCYGTGYVAGYFAPIPCVWAALDPYGGEDVQDNIQTRGMINDVSTKARMLATPSIQHGDVWVDRDTDMRWKIRRANVICAIRGTPVVLSTELRLCNFSDSIYKIEIPNQQPDPGLFY